MDDQARTSHDRPLRLQLDLRLDCEPITGSLRCPEGRDEEFVGWLGFVEALRRLSEAQSKERS
jgi:hypothetical protein